MSVFEETSEITNASYRKKEKVYGIGSDAVEEIAAFCITKQQKNNLTYYIQ